MADEDQPDGTKKRRALTPKQQQEIDFFRKNIGQALTANLNRQVLRESQKDLQSISSDKAEGQAE